MENDLFLNYGLELTPDFRMVLLYTPNDYKISMKLESLTFNIENQNN